MATKSYKSLLNIFILYRTVDFAPDFANQLVNTAVNAAGQAYITAKAVFKTWQDKDKQV